MYNLANTIASLPQIVGCKDFPISEQGRLLIEDLQDFINETYHYSAKQVTDAFNKAASRTLYLDNKRIDPATFGQYLSRSTVGLILTAYKEAKQSERTRPVRRMIEEDIDMPDAKWHYESLLKQIKAMGAMPEYGLWKIIHGHLVSEGILKPLKKKVSSKPEDVRSILLGDLHRIEIRDHLIIIKQLKQ